MAAEALKVVNINGKSHQGTSINGIISEYHKNHDGTIVWKDVNLRNKFFTEIKIKPEHKNKTLREIYHTELLRKKYQINVAQDHISFKNLNLKIQFKRTIRVADDGKVYPLPPDLGNLPICYDTSKVQLAMHPFEALWFNFKFAHDKPLALKIGIGNINAVSGLPWQDGYLSYDSQNYLTLPKQHWLDGIKTEEPTIKTGNGFDVNMVRQFVATEYNGITIEEQMKEKGIIDSIDGRLKFEVFEIFNDKYHIYDPLNDTLLDPNNVPSELGIDKVIIISNNENYNYIEDFNIQDNFKIEKCIFIKTLTSKIIPIAYRKGITVRDVKEEIYYIEGIPIDQHRLIFAGKQLSDHQTLDELGHYPGAIIHLVLRLRGGGNPRNLGMSPGGLIRQCIYQDSPFNRYINFKGCYAKFSVDVIHARDSKFVYQTPISQELYIRYGYPWFEVYDEHIEAINQDVDSGFKELKTIKDINVNLEECYICMENYSNMEFECGHTVCTDCLTELKKEERIEEACPICRMEVDYTTAKTIMGIVKMDE